MNPTKILIIQTAFLGDVILATALIEKLHSYFPQSRIDFVVRKGNETLLHEHPLLTHLHVWNKQQTKLKNLYQLVETIRKEKYDLVINVQRFLSSGILAGFSGAKHRIGFQNNPISFLFTQTYSHEIGNGVHEITRNQQLIASITDEIPSKPKLYPTAQHEATVKSYQTQPYICLAPSSVWFTKQYPMDKWAELVGQLPSTLKIYLLGSLSDKDMCNRIMEKAGLQFNFSPANRVENLCGKLSLLESAALMRSATMNYVNDSAPLHIASAVNAPVCAIFCSTIPAFGFTPLSDTSFIVENTNNLSCRPCGLHGHKKCPQNHFACGNEIETGRLVQILTQNSH